MTRRGSAAVVVCAVAAVYILPQPALRAQEAHSSTTAPAAGQQEAPQEQDRAIPHAESGHNILLGPEQHGTRLHWAGLPRNILHDEVAIFTSPARVNRKDAKWWILFGGATLGLIAGDKYITKHSGKSTTEATASRWASRLGADYSVYPLTFLFYVGGKIGDNPRSRDVGRIGIEAMADAEITVNILKLITQRSRPGEGDGKGHFWDGGDSFPSGHSIKSWALASVVSEEFRDQKWVPPLAYGLAATVGVARVAGRRHWASDALSGSAMGWFIGHYVYHKHHALETKGTFSWLNSHVDLGFTPVAPVCAGAVRTPYCN